MTREGNSYLPVEQGPTAAAQGVIRGNQNNQLRLPDAPQLGGGQGTSGGRITGNFFHLTQLSKPNLQQSLVSGLRRYFPPLKIFFII